MVSKVDLLILGLLMDRPMHGYEISQVIGNEDIRGWLSVSLTSIYYALNKLKKSGSIVETVHKSETSPERVVYHITDEGRLAFFSLMEKSLGSSERPYFDFDLGVHFINRLPRSSVTELLSRRRKFLQSWSHSLTDDLGSAQSQGQSTPSRAILDHSSAFVRMELEWLDRFAAEIGVESDGRLRDAAGRGRLMTLSGDLNSMHLPDVLKFIAAGALTGSLALERDAATLLLYFQEGRPCRVMLRRDGVAIREPEDVMGALRSIFRWESGRVVFEQGGTFPVEATTLSCSVDQLVLEGARQVDTWATIQRLVPSVSTVFERRPGWQAGTLPLSEAETLVVNAIDGTADVSGIASLTGLSIFSASRVLYALSVLGSLRTVDPEKVRMRRSFRFVSESLMSAVATLAGIRAADSCEQSMNAAYRGGDIRILRGRVTDESDSERDVNQASRAYAEFLRIQSEVVGARLGRSFVRESVDRIVREATPELQEVIGRHGFGRALEGPEAE